MEKIEIEKQLKKSPFYKHRKDYADKIIDYPLAPGGKAYVGINKLPLTKSDTQHGYKGIVLQDESRMFVLCNECGEWRKTLAPAHLKTCSGLTVDEYKEKHDINRSAGLINDSTSLKLTAAALKNKDKKRGVATGEYKQSDRCYKKRKRMQYSNRFGTCPEQLKHRLFEFVRCNRGLPGSNNRGNDIYRALKRRYGCYGDALVRHGLPYLKRIGTNMCYTFSDGSIYKFNINQMHDREELYKLIIKKCKLK